MPFHVAVIMDGNNRWAKRRHLPSAEGHKSGVISLRNMVRYCAELNDIKVLTVFAFSSENWSRSEEEVNAIMTLIIRSLVSELPELNQNGVRLHVVGDRSGLSEDLVQHIHLAEEATQDNERMHLVIAINYGGRWDIVNATRQLAEEVKQGRLDPSQIDEACFANYLCLKQFPAPDLLIRTGGDCRISNFLLWQAAYTELYFSDVLWPDYDQVEFDQALASFSKRQRRFGGRTGLDSVS